MAHSSTVLSQILKLVPRHEFVSLAKRHDGPRRSDAFSRWSQFAAMATAHLTGRSSLRDIESTLDSQRHVQYHLGSNAVKRTTLSRANQQLTSNFYETLFSKLYQRCHQGAPGHKFRFKHKLFSLDSTLLDVSLKVFPQREYNRLKAAYKLHVGLDHDGLIPAFATVTPGKTHDQVQARSIGFRPGSVVVFDRGYSDYKWHNQLTCNGIFWVTRIRGNARYKVLERKVVNRKQGVTSDQIIEYTSIRSSKNNLRPVRRIGYRDPETNKHYVFITNQLKWSAKTVADIYKQRWQVELFFKWIKQNLKIKAFMGNSDNAVMTQVLIALCVYLLLAWLKFKARIGLSLQQIIRLIYLNVFARRDLLLLFRPPPDSRLEALQMRLV
jgi:putative transposase